jgi:transcription elongation factor GreA
MREERFLTAEGAAKLRTELAELEGPRRNEISERLRSAISQGDLSENADYHKAKEDQSFLEGRIQEIKQLLSDATIIEVQPGKYDKVDIGARVTIQELDDPDAEPEIYDLVGAKEADPRQGKISNESPIGRALMGASEGQIVTAQTPAGPLRFKIIKIK